MRQDLNREHSVEDVVPNLACESEAEVKVLVMVSKVVFLHLLRIRWESRVVKAVGMVIRVEIIKDANKPTYA